MQFIPFETSRFMLDALNIQDIPHLVQICSMPVINEFLFKMPIPYTIKDAKNFIHLAEQEWEHGNILRWAVRMKSKSNKAKYNPIIALIELRQNQDDDNIGVWVTPEKQGIGVSYECLNTIIAWSLSSQFTKNNLIGYSHHVNNNNSQKLAIKLGFTFKGIRNSQEIGIRNRQNEYYDYCTYYL